MTRAQSGGCQYKKTAASLCEERRLQHGREQGASGKCHPQKQPQAPTFSSLGTIEVKTFSGDGDTPTRTASIVGRAMERAHGWQTSVNLNE